MLKVITPDTIDEPVKRFITGLEISREPSVMEVAGRRVYIVVRPALDERKGDEPWTDAKAKRRYDLVERKLSNTIGPEEAIELAQLNEALDDHIDRVAPLPLDYARNILAKLQAEIGPGPAPQ